jgi:solute carrier family 6 amino acid transporter-like protein 5/7/9/14
VYGVKQFRKDIELMIGKRYTSMKTFWYWISTWAVIAPILLIGLIIFSWVQYKPLKHGNYIYPQWVSFF